MNNYSLYKKSIYVTDPKIEPLMKHATTENTMFVSVKQSIIHKLKYSENPDLVNIEQVSISDFLRRSDEIRKDVYENSVISHISANNLLKGIKDFNFPLLDLFSSDNVYTNNNYTDFYLVIQYLINNYVVEKNNTFYNSIILELKKLIFVANNTKDMNKLRKDAVIALQYFSYLKNINKCHSEYDFFTRASTISFDHNAYALACDILDNPKNISLPPYYKTSEDFSVDIEFQKFGDSPEFYIGLINSILEFGEKQIVYVKDKETNIYSEKIQNLFADVIELFVRKKDKRNNIKKMILKQITLKEYNDIMYFFRKDYEKI